MRKPLIIRFVSWLILLPSSIVLVVFSVINRHSVMINFWPFDFVPEIRLYVVILGVLMVGVFWGGFAVWFAGRLLRRRERESRRLIESISADLRQAKKRIQRYESEVSKPPSTSGRASLAPADRV